MNHLPSSLLLDNGPRLAALGKGRFLLENVGFFVTISQSINQLICYHSCTSLLDTWMLISLTTGEGSHLWSIHIALSGPAADKDFYVNVIDQDLCSFLPRFFLLLQESGQRVTTPI